MSIGEFDVPWRVLPVGRGGRGHSGRKNRETISSITSRCSRREISHGRAAEIEPRETVTTSLCLVFKGRGRSLAPPQIKSINNLLLL